MAYDFASDNTAPVHPKIMAALAACNEGTAPPYGTDLWTERLNRTYSDIFEHEAFVFPVSSGTAANGLALGTVTPTHGAIFCHENAHIVTFEGGAAEFYSGGGRLVPLQGDDNKIDPGTLETVLKGYGPKDIHQMQAAALSLTQATDRGTVYTLDELAGLSAVAHGHGMKVHMDGARFANALASLGASPAEMSWKAGIDILSFGTTKNGTMMSEAVIAFDAATTSVLRFKHKRAGFLHSKMRYFSAQLLAYVEGGLWLSNARAANATARRIADGLKATPGVAFANPVQANQIFVHIPPALDEALRVAGVTLRPRPSTRGDLFRLVASYCEPEDLISRLESVLTSWRRSR